MAELGVDGFGMTPEEAAEHVKAGRMAFPPLGVYRDRATFLRYEAALKTLPLDSSLDRE